MTPSQNGEFLNNPAQNKQHLRSMYMAGFKKRNPERAIQTIFLKSTTNLPGSQCAIVSAQLPLILTFCM